MSRSSAEHCVLGAMSRLMSSFCSLLPVGGLISNECAVVATHLWLSATFWAEEPETSQWNIFFPLIFSLIFLYYFEFVYSTNKKTPSMWQTEDGYDKICFPQRHEGQHKAKQHWRKKFVSIVQLKTGWVQVLLWSCFDSKIIDFYFIWLFYFDYNSVSQFPIYCTGKPDVYSFHCSFATQDCIFPRVSFLFLVYDVCLYSICERFWLPYVN